MQASTTPSQRGCRSSACVQPLGRHRSWTFKGPAHPLWRPRLLRHRPQEACSTSCRRAAKNWASSWCSRRTWKATLRSPDADLIIASDGLNSRIRTQVRSHVFSPTSTLVRPAASCGWARTSSSTRFTFAFEQDRVGLVPGPCLPVRRQHLDLHRRGARATSGAPHGPGHDGARRRALPSARSSSRKHAGRRHPLISNASPPARLGVSGSTSRASSASSWVALTMAARPCGADGRCGAYRPTSPSARVPSWRLKTPSNSRGPTCSARQGQTAMCIPAVLSAVPRPSAASKCCASRTPRATRPSGSRMSTRAMRQLPTRSSSPIRMLTRSQRISHENLRLRDAQWLRR